LLFVLALPIFVGLLIAAAMLASRPETRVAGRVLFGLLIAPLVLVPLYLAASYQGGSNSMPIMGISLFGIILLLAVAVVAGMVAVPGARPVALGVIGCIFVGLLGWFFIETTSVKMAAPTPIVTQAPQPIEGPNERVGRATTPALDPATARAEAGFIPVETESPAQSAAATAPPQPNTPAPAPPAAAPPNAPPAPPAANANAFNGQFRRKMDAPLVVGTRKQLPEWAKTGGGVGKDGNYCTVIVSGPYQSFDFCWQDLSQKLDDSIRNYLQIQPVDSRGRVPRVGMSDELRKMAVTQHFLETADFSVGQMQTLYTRLEFTPQFRETAAAWHRDLLADSRMMFTGIGAAILVALLAIVYGYFRIDTATRGFYTWRLRGIAGVLMVALTILAVATGAMFMDQESRLGGYMF
jgi:hypothetical protein